MKSVVGFEFFGAACLSSLTRLGIADPRVPRLDAVLFIENFRLNRGATNGPRNHVNRRISALSAAIPIFRPRMPTLMGLSPVGRSCLRGVADTDSNRTPYRK